MKHTILVLMALLMITLGSGVASGSGRTESGTITIRYADVQAENDTETMAARKFSELVAEKSGGRIVVQVFPGGQLGDMRDIMQGVQMGSVEMCRNNPGWLADAGARKMSIMSLPFIFDNLEHANAVIYGDIGTELLADIQQSGLGMIGLGYLEPSLRHFFFRNRTVTKLSDLAGMRLRVPTNEMNTAMVAALGASATPIAYNELYTALQTGLVDGAENPTKGFTNMRFGEVAKHFTFTGHQYEPSVLLVNEAFWNRLSPADQRILRQAMDETAVYYQEISKEMYEQYIADGERLGVTFVDVDDITEWQRAVQPLYARFGQGMEDLIRRIQNTTY